MRLTKCNMDIRSLPVSHLQTQQQLALHPLFG